jgi:hypothetical protein
VSAFVEALGVLVSNEIAVAMIGFIEVPHAYVAARAWLEAHEALAGPLLETRTRGDTTTAETAREILARFARRRSAA